MTSRQIGGVLKFQIHARIHAVIVNFHSLHSHFFDSHHLCRTSSFEICSRLPRQVGRFEGSQQIEHLASSFRRRNLAEQANIVERWFLLKITAKRQGPGGVRHSITIIIESHCFSADTRVSTGSDVMAVGGFEGGWCDVWRL